MRTRSFTHRLLAVTAGAGYFTTLTLPWQRNAISGSRKGIDVLGRPGSDGRWLAVSLLAVALATAAWWLGFFRVATIAAAAGALSLVFVRRLVQGDFARSYGQDPLGRVDERDAFSSVTIGYYCAVAAVAFLLVGATIQLRRSTVKRNCREGH
jgi:hypothetical protein